MTYTEFCKYYVANRAYTLFAVRSNRRAVVGQQLYFEFQEFSMSDVRLATSKFVVVFTSGKRVYFDSFGEACWLADTALHCQILPIVGA